MKCFFSFLLIAWVILNSVLIASTSFGARLVCEVVSTEDCIDSSNVAGIVLSGRGSDLLNVGLTDNEIDHLRDVSMLLNKVKILWFFLGVTLLVVAIKSKKEFGEIVDGGIRFGLGLLILLVGLAGLAWKFFFISFHQIFFPQGNWSFPAESLLINFYPEIFWQAMVVFILILSTVTLTLMKVVTRPKR